MYSNFTSDVKIITTDDLEVGTVLNNLYYNQLEVIPKISEVSILNNSGFSVTITDCHGVVTTSYSKPVTEMVLDKMKLPISFTGVVILERRSINPTDLKNTADYYTKYAGTTKYTTRVENIHKTLRNLLTPNRLREYYIVYAMTNECLRTRKSIRLRSPNIIVSIPGQEMETLLMRERGISDLFTGTSESALGVSYTYYSSEAGSVYINTAGTVLRLDAVPVEEDDDEGVLMHRSHDGIIDTQLIRPDEFNSRFIFKTLREAKNNMSDEQLLATRKIDLEYLKTESGFITSVLTEASNVYKLRIDLSSRLLTSITEREKAIRTVSKSSTPLDDIKKIVDIISMIGKIVL